MSLKTPIIPFMANLSQSSQAKKAFSQLQPQHQNHINRAADRFEKQTADIPGTLTIEEVTLESPDSMSVTYSYTSPADTTTVLETTADLILDSPDHSSVLKAFTSALEVLEFCHRRVSTRRSN